MQYKRYLSASQERYYATILRQNDMLVKNNEVLREENLELKRQAEQLKEAMKRVHALECEYTQKIQIANEVISSCKQAIARCRQLDQDYRTRVLKMTHGMVR